MKNPSRTFAALAAVVALLSLPTLAGAKAIDYKGSVDVQSAKPGKIIEKIRGFVFEDINRNGKFNKGEPGIAGVMVSNGRDVVLTDNHGRYHLPAPSAEQSADGITIFITKPAGYEVPTDQDNVPQFFYHHKPDGSPANVRGEKFRFGGLEPTGPLPKQINFPLIKSKPKKNFRIAVSGDTQPYSNNEVGYVRDTLAHELAAMPDIEAVIIEGDVVGDDLGLLPRFKRIMSISRSPLYLVPGNHDLDFDAPSDIHSFDSFKQLWGPSYYSFDIGEVHFVVLDDVSYPCTPDQNKDGLHGFCDDPENNPTYNGYITNAQMEWLKNDLHFVPPHKLVVINVHIPPQVFIDMNASKHQIDNVLALYDLLGYGPSNYPQRPALALSGHSHTLEQIRPGESYLGWETALGDRSPGAPPFPQIVAGAACGSWWSSDFDDNGIPMSYQRLGSPRGYLLIEFNGNTYKDTFKASGKSIKKQMSLSILSPTFEDWAGEMINWMQQDPTTRSEIPPVNVNDLPDTKMVLIDELAHTDLVANIWNGSKESEVYFQVDHRPPVKMVRTQEGEGEDMLESLDPFALRMQLYSYRHAARSQSGNPRTQGFELWTGAHFGPDIPQPLDEWMLTDQSQHLWQAPLPSDLKEGVHHARVGTIDLHGNVYTDSLTFEVVKERPPAFFRSALWEVKP
jgi:hypothetical protein